MNRIARTLAAVTVAGVMALAPLSATASPSRPVPCASEDSNGCYWNAAVRGNGIGDSYYAAHDGTVVYVSGFRAHPAR